MKKLFSTTLILALFCGVLFATVIKTIWNYGDNTLHPPFQNEDICGYKFDQASDPISLGYIQLLIKVYPADNLKSFLKKKGSRKRTGDYGHQLSFTMTKECTEFFMKIFKDPNYLKYSLQNVSDLNKSHHNYDKSSNHNVITSEPESD